MWIDDLTKALYFGPWNRLHNNWYSTENVPNMDCPNETDRFTVSNINGNGALTYPVGMLTIDEIILAGNSGAAGQGNDDYYLYVGTLYRTLSPYLSKGNAPAVVISMGNGVMSTMIAASFVGLRPVVSLKPGIEFEPDGDGTPTNPYIVKYN